MTNNQQLAAHCRDVIANPQDHLDWVVDMAKAALRTIDTDVKIYTPAAFTARDAKMFCAAHKVEGAYELASQMANYAVDKVVRLNAAHTAQIEPICATGGAEWVKCSARLPEVNEEVIAFIAQSNEYKGKAFPAVRYEEYWWLDGESYSYDEVSHWQPMPAAPED